MKQMKRLTSYITYVVICVITGLLSACVDNEEDTIISLEQKSIKVDYTSLALAANPEKSAEIKIQSVNVAWKFTDLAVDWVKLTPISGRESADVQVIVAENTDPTTARTATWKFSVVESGLDYSCPMSLSQEAAGYFVKPEKTDIQVSAPATTYSIGVLSNGQWTASSNKDWVACITTKNLLTLNIKENTETVITDRDATIILTCKSSQAIVTIHQHPANITTKTDELVFENTGGTYQLNVESDVTWNASTSLTWLDVSPSSSPAGKTPLKITATPNNSASQRTGNVYIKVGTTQKYQIPVRQQGLYVIADKTTLQFGFQSSFQEIAISSNTEWQVISKPNFVTSVTPNGTQQGNKKLQITVSPNEGIQREGDVVVGVPNVSGLQQKVHIVQEGPYMQPDAFTVNLGSTKDSKHKITLNTNDDWNARMQTGTWATVSPTSGTGTAEVTITVEDNPTLTERTDNMIVTCPNANDINVTILQKGRFLNVDKSQLSFFVMGGKEILTITTDATYEVHSTVEWAKVMRDGNIIIIEVGELFECDLREGAIIITMTGLKQGEYKLTIPIYQRKGIVFDVVNFTKDECWDLTNGQQNISVEGFGTDYNWNIGQ